MMMLLRALSAGLAILVVLAPSLGAQQRGIPQEILPPSLPPLHLPIPPRAITFDEAELMLLRQSRLQAAQTKPTQQEEFTPVSELPPEEQLAAAPLLVGAYMFVLAVLFGYLVTVSRRLSAIERDINRLAVEVKPAGRG